MKYDYVVRIRPALSATHDAQVFDTESIKHAFERRDELIRLGWTAWVEVRRDSLSAASHNALLADIERSSQDVAEADLNALSIDELDKAIDLTGAMRSAIIRERYRRKA